MYLGYVDDTGNDEASPIAIMCAVLIDHRLFYQIEDAAGTIIGDLIPEGQTNKFKEFKAADLFHGHEAFQGIPREKRMSAMFSLLHEIRRFQIPVLYSAVDRAQLEAVAASSVIVSLNPVVAAFKMCLLGIQAWLEAQHGIGELGLLICDETEDNFLKANLRSTFRSLRTKRLPPEWKERRLKNIHDELYFSDSRDSIGIQMADLCAWVVQRSIRSEDVPDLFEEISASTNCAKAEPEWSRNPNIFVEYKR